MRKLRLTEVKWLGQVTESGCSGSFPNTGNSVAKQWMQPSFYEPSGQQGTSSYIQTKRSAQRLWKWQQVLFLFSFGLVWFQWLKTPTGILIGPKDNPPRPTSPVDFWPSMLLILINARSLDHTVSIKTQSELAMTFTSIGPFKICKTAVRWESPPSQFSTLKSE